MDRTSSFPTFEEEELPPPTMRSPESTLRVRDHVVAVELAPPRAPLRRAKAPSLSGFFAVASIESDQPTRRFRVA